MLKFIKKFTLFMVPILIFSIAMEISLRNIPNNFTYKKEYLDKNSRSIQALILGTSTAYYGIDPQYIQMNSFNAAGQAQSLNFDLEILKKFNWDNLKYIIIPIEYISLYLKLDKYNIDPWRVKNYSLYYDIITPHNIAYYNEITSLSLRVNLNRLIDYYLLNTSSLSTSTLGWGTNYNSKHHVNLKDSDKQSNKMQDEVVRNSNYYDENVENLQAIIKIAEAYNCKLILFTPPVYNTLAEKLDKNVLQKTTETIKTLERGHPNITYLNLLNDPSFLDTDFYDAKHLNELGAKKLSLIFNSILNGQAYEIYSAS